jgi:hypothetical protein
MGRRENGGEAGGILIGLQEANCAGETLALDKLDDPLKLVSSECKGPPARRQHREKKTRPIEVVPRPYTRFSPT